MRIDSSLEENLIEVRKKWVEISLPKSMKNLTFLDVGCWGGGFVKLAMEKGAKKALGIDIIKSKHNLIRFHVGKNLTIKYTPELRFYYDDTMEQTDKINQLINSVKYSD